MPAGEVVNDSLFVTADVVAPAGHSVVVIADVLVPASIVVTGLVVVTVSVVVLVRVIVRCSIVLIADVEVSTGEAVINSVVVTVIVVLSVCEAVIGSVVVTTDIVVSTDRSFVLIMGVVTCSNCMYNVIGLVIASIVVASRVVVISLIVVTARELPFRCHLLCRRHCRCDCVADITFVLATIDAVVPAGVVVNWSVVVIAFVIVHAYIQLKFHNSSLTKYRPAIHFNKNN